MERIRLLPVEGQPTKAVLAQIYMGVFLILSLHDTIFRILFLPNPPRNRRAPPLVRGPQFDKQCIKLCLWESFLAPRGFSSVTELWP
jgi:hypothetical protein